jgi:hypothetical protein
MVQIVDFFAFAFLLEQRRPHLRASFILASQDPSRRRLLVSDKTALSGTTSSVLVSIEDKIRTQKSDPYTKLDTVVQRQKACAVVEALARDIDIRFDANRSANRRNRKKILPSHSISELPSPGTPDLVADFRLPSSLKAGASFTLWPPRSLTSSTALREGLSDRKPRLSEFGALVSTRWDLDKN